MNVDNGAAAAPAREREEPGAHTAARNARIKALQDQYSRGEYHVDARELAAQLVRVHLRESRAD